MRSSPSASPYPASSAAPDNHVIEQSAPVSDAVVSALENAQLKANTLSSILNSAAFSDLALRNERSVVQQQFRTSLAGLSDMGLPFTEAQRQALQEGLTAYVEAGARVPSMQISDDSPRTHSDVDLWELIMAAISGIGNSYLGVYEDVLTKYTEFFKAFSNKILAMMSTWIKPGSDDNTVGLDVNGILGALRDLLNEFSPPNGGVLLPREGDTENGWYENKSEAEEWASELPGSRVVEDPEHSGHWKVVIDMGPIDNMIAELEKLGTFGPIDIAYMNNAQFQSWQASFNSQQEILKNALQTLTQKYSNANSTYDNLVKVLSSTISACLETAKSFLQA
ncbi:hypothetical protein BUE93_09135 [Chromobacterium amazonense]|uniref:Translocator protein BipD n=1 Tax=Chromobacterium amazonense TaxID=1382803 RepID=A0A2S9X5I8_9NEIS|nr:hypothetical protein BUE93_09135 [Chromobacterium amazonense]